MLVRLSETTAGMSASCRRRRPRVEDGSPVDEDRTGADVDVDEQALASSSDSLNLAYEVTMREEPGADVIEEPRR